MASSPPPFRSPTAPEPYEALLRSIVHSFVGDFGAGSSPARSASEQARTAEREARSRRQVNLAAPRVAKQHHVSLSAAPAEDSAFARYLPRMRAWTSKMWISSRPATASSDSSGLKATWRIS